MKLTDIISITGKPGLFRLVNRYKTPFMVEDLESGRKMPVFPRDSIASLADISIYTTEDDMPLGEVFEKIQAHYPDGVAEAEAILNNRDKLRGWMLEVLPVYDVERVHDSDIKKLLRWYNLLRKAGMEQFVLEETKESPEEKA